MTRSRTLLTCTLAAILCNLPIVQESSAQSRSQQAHSVAAQLSESAYASYTAGDFERAVDLFQQAIVYDPHPVLRFNYARTLEELDQLPAALAVYRHLESDAEIRRVTQAAIERRERIEMRLLQEGYNPDTVTADQYRPLSTIVVRTNASNARVFVDGRRAGEGELVEFEWRAGKRQLFVWAEGWYPWHGHVTFQEADNVFEIQLRERTSLTDYIPPPPGLLTVTGPVSGMAIYIDGALHDKLTPARELLLHEGSYDVVVRHPLYEDWHTRIAVRAGEETRLSSENIYGGGPEARLLPRQRAGNALMGVGAAAIAGSVATGVFAARTARDYRNSPSDPRRDETRDRALTYARSTDALAIIGGLSFGTGLALRVISPKEEENHYEERLLDFSPGTAGSPFGATFTFRP